MIRLLLDTRAHPHSTALGLGLDKNMAMAIYRVGREDEFTEVISILLHIIRFFSSAVFFLPTL